MQLQLGSLKRTLRWIRSVGFSLAFLMTEIYKRKKCTLPETNSSPLKMDGWNTTFLLGRPIFRGYVSFREGIPNIMIKGWGILPSPKTTRIPQNYQDMPNIRNMGITIHLSYMFANTSRSCSQKLMSYLGMLL